ncbi:MAG: alginate lyase family protein [Bacteroidaceae bacterium]|nr:alginate lyase family protein [Bacteroidaceae bacterium]
MIRSILTSLSRSLMLGLLCSSMLMPAVAQTTDKLVLHYDFVGAEGTTVPDASGSGIDATLRNGASVETVGEWSVLHTGSAGGFLDMTAKAGELFRTQDDYTISMYYRVNKATSLSGNGHFLWAFSTTVANSATSGKYSAYRLNAQRFANSTGGYNNETGIEVGGESAKDEWIHVLYTQSGRTGRLYLNGTLAGSSTSMPTNTTNFTEAVNYAWIGRPPFSGDNYLKNTHVADIRLYDCVLGADDIALLAARTEELEDAWRYGQPGDLTALREAVAKAEEYLAGLSLIDYPALAVEEYRDALRIATAACADGRLSQTIIDEYQKALATAKTRLEATRGFVFDAEGIVEGYDTDRGFRHPGGLHTDADFERIRRQIAEGNPEVVAAYNVLKEAAYSQSSAATYPVETIVRGGGVGENYMNAARGATIAYQNALRWKIDGSEAHAKHAVAVLMQWARTTKGIGGDSNFALAAGLYGYQFAQAAELMRDYEGWKREDFETFRRWMLEVWYPSCIDFMRRRNNTWENIGGQGGGRPGHYWSNWGLCNVMALMTIGILCDDVYIYNQGLSFYKYDHVGTFTDNRGSVISNDGLNEFLGNLVPIVYDDERGPYGELGQMQESGRDQGHSYMAMGLAADICQMAWNQGDDLYSYMDNRLAAGIEYVAAYNNCNVDDLPWTTYRYAGCRTAWHLATVHSTISASGRGHMRPVWGRIIGHYEGIKGVEMQYASRALQQMGIDGGGVGSTSGGYDHLGYTVLTSTQDGKATPDKVPTLLTPQIIYNGTTIAHNELGATKQSYAIGPTTAIAPGAEVTLSPQLPAGEEDTGLWQWNTGATTKDITFTANESRVYRATYTNARGIKSEQVFTIAVAGDCEATSLAPSITIDGTTIRTTEATVFYGSSVTLSVSDKGGWGTYAWENGQKGSAMTIPAITSDRDITVVFTNQGGRKSTVTFKLRVQHIRPEVQLNGTTHVDTRVIVAEEGDRVVLRPAVSEILSYGTWLWDDGATSQNYTIDAVSTSSQHSVSFTLDGATTTCPFYVYMNEGDRVYREFSDGLYLIRNHYTGHYLTNSGEEGASPFLAPLDANADTTEVHRSQVWKVEHKSMRYNLISQLDGLYLNKEGQMKVTTLRPFRIKGAKDTHYLSFENTGTTGDICWTVGADGSINYAGAPAPVDYPFELIAADDLTLGLSAPTAVPLSQQYYSLGGIRLEAPQSGIVICRRIWSDGSVSVEKMLVR